MLSTFDIYEELKESLDEKAARTLTKSLAKIYEELNNSVTKEEFKELKGVVSELAEAQKRTEKKVEELAEAQKRTEKKVEELAEAQKRTEKKVEELAEAQKRTEKKVEELAEAQKRTEKKVEELAEAQKRTEQRVDVLSQKVDGLVDAMKQGFQKVNDQISALGSRWGIKNETMVRNTISDLLKNLGYTVSRGFYGGREVDVIIRNGTHILLEITASALKKDVRNINISAEDYLNKHGIEPRLILAAIYISPVVMREITESPRRIDVYSGDEEDKNVFEI